MREQVVRPRVLVKLVLLTMVVFLLPTLLNANVFSHLKHRRQQTSKVTPPQAAGLARMRRLESLPGRTKEGDREGGPLAYEIEKLANKAYPGTDIPFAFTKAASEHFASVRAQSETGVRGQTLHSQWTSIGPSVAQYPAVLGRTGAAYVASGRVSAMAIENNCHREHCRLYVGAAGGGIWRTNNALSDHPRWTQISDSFATNAIGAITIAPADPSGNTIYVGTGEPNASAHSGSGQGVYKSTDGGDSWTLLAGSTFAINRSIGSVVIDPTNANTIYVGTARGIRGF